MFLRAPKFQIACIIAVSCFCSAVGLADDDRWPQFRGADGQGHSSQAELPVQFDLAHGMRWRTPIPGKGWSSPVVADGKIWLTTAITRPATEEEQKRKLANVQFQDIKEVAANVQLLALCLDLATGKIVHNIELELVNDPQPINPLNTYASPTPVIDQNRVYCHFGNYGTWCLDASTGETIWQAKLVVDHSVGPGSSPIVCGDKLILVCDGCDQQFIAALDKNSGREVWRTPRPPLRADSEEMRKSFSTPLLIEVDGKQQLVIPGAQWIVGYAPDSGDEIWRIDHGDGFSLSATPVYSGGLVIFSTGYSKPDLVAVRPTGHGDVTRTHVAWRVSRGAPVKPSPIVVDDRVYIVSDNGVLTQLNLVDGSENWRQRIGAEFSASPVAAGGKLYFPSHEGTISVIQAGDSFERLAENMLEPRLMASPAIVGSDLVIRSEEALMRFSN